MAKSVYLPILPEAKMRTSSVTPARKERSKRRNVSTTKLACRLRALVMATRLWGFMVQPRPRQVTVTRAPTGACTLTKLSLTPAAVWTPAMRTSGNGCIGFKGDRPTGIVWRAMLEAPRASVTRRRTRWLPKVEKDVLATGPDTLNGPFPARSQERPVIGLMASLELDTSTTVCPTTGAGGNQLNEATGSALGCVGGAVSVNVTGALAPVLPAASLCSAWAV